jgi:hypothetical protein
MIENDGQPGMALGQGLDLAEQVWRQCHGRNAMPFAAAPEPVDDLRGKPARPYPLEECYADAEHAGLREPDSSRGA